MECTRDVAIGPLEYCGNGIPVKNTNGKFMYVFSFVFLVHNSRCSFVTLSVLMSISDPDPQKPIHLVERHLRALAQRGRRSSRHSTTVTPMSDADRKIVNTAISTARSIRSNLKAADDGDEADEEELMENEPDSELEYEAGESDSDSDGESGDDSAQTLPVIVAPNKVKMSSDLVSRRVPKTGRRGVDSLIASQTLLEPQSKRRRISRGISFAPSHPNDVDIFGSDYDNTLLGLDVNIKPEIE